MAQIALTFKSNENDLLTYLESKSSKSGYLKDLLKQDMERNGVPYSIEPIKRKKREVNTEKKSSVAVTTQRKTEYVEPVKEEVYVEPVKEEPVQVEPVQAKPLQAKPVTVSPAPVPTPAYEEYVEEDTKEEEVEVTKISSSDDDSDEVGIPLSEDQLSSILGLMSIGREEDDE